MRCCFICSFKPGLLFSYAIEVGREFQALIALYNTVCFLDLVLDLGTVKTPPGGMSGGISVCVSSGCKLTMQTIWDITHNVSNKKVLMQSVSPQLLAKRDWHG